MPYHSADLFEVAKTSPHLASLLKRAIVEEEAFAQELMNDPMSQIAPTLDTSGVVSPVELDSSLPIVVTHGMGDSCFNPGMKSITEAAGKHMGVYSVCIPGGDTQSSDTMSGFFVNMDKNVDIFAAKVKNDTRLANGFNAFGLSQGNSVIRGYIERYNDPPVHDYLSVHGTVMGVAGFPNCNPKGLLGPVCRILASIAGPVAYSETFQNHLFQANYLRDPKLTNSSEYLTHSQIAQWNNENPAAVTASYKTNFASLNRYAMIKALKDTMVYPNDGEWWGQFAPGGFSDIQQMNQTAYYQQDLFGLQTVDKAGKIFYDTTPGEHLQFTVEQLTGWLDRFFKN